MKTIKIHNLPSREKLVNTHQQYQVLSEWAKLQSRNMRPGSINSVPHVSNYFGGNTRGYNK